MFITYNKKGVGDVLIIPLKQSENHTFTKETYGDVVKITDAKENVLGYNLFNASSYVNFEKEGQILLTDELLEQIHSAFEQNELTDKLDVDTTPKFVVGHVKASEQHEDADKLSVCQVDVGNEQLQIVCGAANVAAGQKVVVAKVGATMPSGLAIKPTKLRGVDSYGMICSREELGLPKDPKEDGIYVLDDSAKVGEPFQFE